MIATNLACRQTNLDVDQRCSIENNDSADASLHTNPPWREQSYVASHPSAAAAIAWF